MSVEIVILMACGMLCGFFLPTKFTVNKSKDTAISCYLGLFTLLLLILFFIKYI